MISLRTCAICCFTHLAYSSTHTSTHTHGIQRCDAYNALLTFLLHVMCNTDLLKFQFFDATAASTTAADYVLWLDLHPSIYHRVGVS